MLLSLLGIALRTVARISPAAASILASQLFRTPRRFRTPERETVLLDGAEPFALRLSPSTNGASSGRTSSLPHFTWALRRVADAVGEPHAVIGHSLGCAAATLAMHEGLRVGRAVYFAPPLDPADYTRKFGEMFGLRNEVIHGLQMRIEERFIRKWDDYSLAAMAPRMTARLLVIHDRGDDDTPYQGGARLAELWPGARLMTTEGLGHRRILREASTVGAATEFLSASSLT